MAYIDLKYFSEPEFKRLCGVSRNTFTEMAEVLRSRIGTSRTAWRAE